MTMPAIRVPEVLRQRGIDTVLDVGANDGGFASSLIEWGYRGRILSFEPLPTIWEKLVHRAAKGRGNWEVAPRMALSDTNGSVKFFEAENSVSSSLLPMLNAHLDAAPDSKPVGEIEVQARRLDDVANDVDLGKSSYLKIDVQGGERLVLDGARNVIDKIVVGIQLEMSVTDLYQGQSIYHELDARIRGLGFSCVDIIPGFRDSSNFNMLQFDAIYFRP